MFDWADYLVLAERLAEQATDEATQRTAISRAYYAAYHVAAEFVRAHGLLRAAHSHRTVWGTLVANPNPDLSNVGMRGNWLKQTRMRADYRNPYPGDLDRQVREVMIESTRIVEALRRWA